MKILYCYTNENNIFDLKKFYDKLHFLSDLNIFRFQKNIGCKVLTKTRTDLARDMKKKSEKHFFKAILMKVLSLEES